MESQSQQSLAEFGATMIMALALVEKSLSERNPSEINPEAADKEPASGSQLGCKIEEIDPLQPSCNTPAIAGSNLSAASKREWENPQRTASFVPQSFALPRTMFAVTDLFRDNAAAIIRNKYQLWQKGQFWNADLILPRKEESALERLLKAANCLDTLKQSGRIGSIHLEMAYLLHFLCYTEFMKGHVRTDKSASETFLKHLYADDWNQIGKEAQQKRRTQLQKQVSVGKRWYITVGKLSYGALILCGKKLSTVIHTTYIRLEGLNALLSYILESYPTVVEIYKRIDPAVQHILAAEPELPLLESGQISTEIEDFISAIQEGQIGVPSQSS